MQAVILCGGVGSRMGWRTKSLILVRGRPFILHQLARLEAAGFDEIVFATTDEGDGPVIAYILGKLWRPKRSAVFSNQPKAVGTMRALEHAHKKGYLAEEFLVTYGDSFIDYRYGFAALSLAQSAISKLAAVVTVCKCTPKRVNGNVDVSADGKFATSIYKGAHDGSDFIDYGAIAMRRDPMLEGGIIEDDLNLELDHWARTSVTDDRGKKNGMVRALVVPEMFHEIGTPEGLADLEAHLARKESA